MSVLGTHTYFKKFSIKFNALIRALMGWLLPFVLLGLLVACGGGDSLQGADISGFPGGGGGPGANPFAGGALDGGGNQDNNTSNTGNPGGQPTQDGVIRPGPISGDPRGATGINRDEMVLSSDTGSDGGSDTSPPDQDQGTHGFGGGAANGILEEMLLQ